MESTLAQAANSMCGTLQGSDLKFRGVSTDTRTLREGELFFALQGPNFDGAAFVVGARSLAGRMLLFIPAQSSYWSVPFRRHCFALHVQPGLRPLGKLFSIRCIPKQS